MSALTGKRILILATHGFEQSELDIPHAALQKAGATVDIVSPEAGEIKGWQNKDWGRHVSVDRTLDQARAEDYDAIVLPGGQMNPDTLRGNDKPPSGLRRTCAMGTAVAGSRYRAAPKRG